VAERYFEVERALEIAEKFTTVVSHALSLFIILSMFGDLLGVSVPELVWRAVTVPWVIPVDIIAQYYHVWYSMYCALFVLIVADYAVYMRYMQLRRTPPLAYVRYMALATFILSFWLALLFRTFTLTLIAVLSSATLAYSVVAKG
jgi:hypothetical protein